MAWQSDIGSLRVPGGDIVMITVSNVTVIRLVLLLLMLSQSQWFIVPREACGVAGWLLTSYLPAVRLSTDWQAGS